MSALSIQPTYPIFTETDGQPLEDGYIWIGTVNLDPQGNPINVYWDAALTQLAGQPIRTQGGYPVNSGTPARLYVNSDYSIRVMNKNGSVVYSAPAATERYSDVVVSGMNAEDVIYDPPFLGGVQTNVEAKLAQVVSVKDFGAVGNSTANDTTAFQNAINSGATSVYVPDGTYLLDSFTITGVKLFGSGTLKWNGPASTDWITLNNNAELNGLAFDGNASAHSFVTDTGGIYVVGTNCNISNCDFSNFRKYAIWTIPDSATGGRVANCRFHDSGTIPNSNALTIRSSNWVVDGNTFDGTNWGADAHMIRTGQFNVPSNSVSNISITGNFFTNPQYTCIVLELMSQNISISGNTFDTALQGVKIESAGGTQTDISITGNTLKNLTQEAGSNNLTGTRVVFDGNIVNSAGSTDLGPYGICSNNTFYNCGSSSYPEAAITAYTASNDCLIQGNLVINSKWRGISCGTRTICRGNRVISPIESGIVGNASATITNNYVTGGTYGIIVSSAATNAYVAGNKCESTSTGNYSITYTTGLYIDQTNVGYVGASPTQTINSGAITITYSSTVIPTTVDTEGAAATDDLDTITPTNPCLGQLVILRSASSARTVVVKDNTGNLQLAGDFSLTSTADRLMLVWNGSSWTEISRSDNA